MIEFLSRFAAEDGPHISLKAEALFSLGGVTITNSILYGAFVAVILIILGLLAARSSGLWPKKGLAELFEISLEFVVSVLTNIFGSRSLGLKYAPTFGVFFIFIMLSNLSGLLPVVGAGVTYNGLPLLRPFTADLNGTLAMAVSAILLVQVLSIKESGWLGHLKHYFTDKPFNPINFFIGLLEVFGELTRVMSLSLRLFLNTAVGEILIAVFAFVGQNGSSFTVLPIVLFEVLVAFIQAYVFTVLSATYLSLAISHGDHDEAHAEEHRDQPAELRSLPGEA